MKTVLVFTKKRFIKDRGRVVYKDNKVWVDRLNGWTVEKIQDMGYMMSLDYCKTIKVKDHV